jgi:hypothetical protein
MSPPESHMLIGDAADIGQPLGVCPGFKLDADRADQDAKALAVAQVILRHLAK